MRKEKHSTETPEGQHHTFTRVTLSLCVHSPSYRLHCPLCGEHGSCRVLYYRLVAGHTRTMACSLPQLSVSNILAIHY